MDTTARKVLHLLKTVDPKAGLEVGRIARMLGLSISEVCRALEGINHLVDKRSGKKGFGEATAAAPQTPSPCFYRANGLGKQTPTYRD